MYQLILRRKPSGNHIKFFHGKSRFRENQLGVLYTRVCLGFWRGVNFRGKREQRALEGTWKRSLHSSFTRSSGFLSRPALDEPNSRTVSHKRRKSRTFFIALAPCASYGSRLVVTGLCILTCSPGTDIFHGLVRWFTPHHPFFFLRGYLRCSFSRREYLFIVTQLSPAEIFTFMFILSINGKIFFEIVYHVEVKIGQQCLFSSRGRYLYSG